MGQAGIFTPSLGWEPTSKNSPILYMVQATFRGASYFPCMGKNSELNTITLGVAHVRGGMSSNLTDCCLVEI